MEFMTPRKKRPAIEDDDQLVTPKKVRTAPLSPPPTRPLRPGRTLPTHLSRLLTLHASIEQALSIALATSSVGVTRTPTKDGVPTAGRMINVINHIGMDSLGSNKRCSVEDLSRLVWLWEWDGTTLPGSQFVATAVADTEADNPFLVTPKDWSRGGMGLVVTPTTHFSRAMAKRLPAYGIGIQVEAKGKKYGMSSLAQWTASAEDRRTEMGSRLTRWVELHTRERVKHRETSRSSSPTPSPVPNIPFAGLPSLQSATANAVSSLTKTLLATPRKGPSAKSAISFPTPSSKPSSPEKRIPEDPASRPQTPETPRKAVIPDTPTSSRRAALFERVRLKSLNTPTKNTVQVTTRNAQGEETTRAMNSEEIKRRCLLGRLGGVADAVWMLFSAPPQSPSSNPTPPTRRRRTIPTEEVVTAIVKSSRTPISSAEATESIRLLLNLCPDFLKSMVIDKSEWLQMAASSAACPPSPSAKRDNEEEIRKRKVGQGSPIRIKPGTVTLRDVKERIRRELETS